MSSRICIRDLPGNISNVDHEIRALIGKVKLPINVNVFDNNMIHYRYVLLLIYIYHQ